ncbi:helix-turn-helix domain-containing protein [Flagellimonas allohymeniacidonis]|uniref:AraC family transcriptional regulator n=1 Tax=Flagellimonas allohymeniacidonis TaxID=2517819 RepID=A0A4Q8QGF0_9FLAO|nr:helix-turn-helix domain-containing protein [Allomuricauda hymeniacidonis]TAI48807.1 AraC family transcriptional regulator [Allomuricauda hymeniacidonis]
MGKRLLVICLMLASVWTYPIQKGHPATLENTMYRCPPCGCAQDTHLFAEPGLCPECQMQLVPTSSGFSETVDTTIAPFLEAGMLGQLYTKLIYPVFAMGILLSLFFLLKSFKGKSLSVFLAGIILVISLYGFKNQLYAVNYSLTNSYKSLFIPISFILLLGPLIWLYVKSLLENPFKWKPTYWFHFVPAAISFLYYTFLLVAPEHMKLQFMFSPFEVQYSHGEQILAVLLGLIYIFLSYRLFQSWKKELPSKNATLVSWAIRFLAGTTLSFVVWGAMIFINYWIYDFGVATVSYNPLWLVFALVLLWLGAEVFSNSKFFLLNKGITTVNGSMAMTSEDLSILKNKLHHVMENQKVYLDTNLSLDRLAHALDLNPKQLSALLNGILGISFYDFVNQYRVNEVTDKLKDRDNRKLTIEAIANQSGFKSKSSFNAAFRKQLGMTPREFIRQELGS